MYRVRLVGDGGLFASGEDHIVAVTTDGELIISSTERERNVGFRYFETGLSTNTWVGLVDLSDTTGYPHDETGRLDVSQLYVLVDPSSAQGAVQIGLVKRVGDTDGDVDLIDSLRFTSSSVNETKRRDLNFAPSQLKLGLDEANTPIQYVSNQEVTNVTDLSDSATLDAPAGDGSFTPEVGDLVARLQVDSGAYDASVSGFYHAEA